MSSRALRRLKGKQRGQEALDLGDLVPGEGPEPEEQAADVEEEEEEPDEAVLQSVKSSIRKAKKNKKNLSNIYELICDAENEAEKATTDEDTVKPEEQNGDESKEKSDSRETEKRDAQPETGAAKSGDKTSKKKKKKKKKKNTTGDKQEGAGDDIDALLETIEQSNGLTLQSEGCGASDNRPVLYVEHRNLNPETELKRYFGARAVLGDQRPRQRQRQFHRSTWMTIPKNTWPRFSRPGISMTLLESRDGLQYFTFEHSRDYQQIQFKFLDSVESMDPNNIVALLQMNPYHIDSLLQLSDVCRIQEDQEMARDLIERALYSFECAFHPVCSLTSGTSRLDYLRPENRAFYLAGYKHMMFLERRGCPRTALEYCRLILRCVCVCVCVCAVVCIVHRNLSQLPNFAFSVALSHFHLSQEDQTESKERERLKHKADLLLQDALIMFPGVLMPLLDLCTVQPDAAVSSHDFFGPRSQLGQTPALAELVSLYVGRTHTLWREGGVLLWLEECVREVLRRVDAKDPLVEDCQNKRKQRYQSAPLNIHRHVILSEIKEATSTLPLEVTTQSVMGFDPLPPLDSVVSYTRPERQSLGESNESTLSLFFRSLLPNFNLQGEPMPQDDLEVAQAGRELNQEVNRLMVAMRDMLANIQFQEPPREDNPDRDEGEWD
uniref:Transcription factor 25 n=1 Tax=Oncorhynchus tshawytscha TaxID=74940 RepID=A0A8C8FV11_ONCTS